MSNRKLGTLLTRWDYSRLNKSLQPEITVPSAFEVGKGWIFKPWEVRLLVALFEGKTTEEAYQAIGIPPEKGERLLRSKKAREFLADRVKEKMGNEAWTQDKWMAEGLKVWKGEREASREQLSVWQELGARVAPKPEKVRHDSERPIININIGKLEEADRRAQVIEVKEVKEIGSNPAA